MENKKILNASEMGKKGGTNRAKNLSKKRRSEIASMGGKARWIDKSLNLMPNIKELDVKNKII